MGFIVGVGGASKAPMPMGCWKSILAGLERFISLVHFEVKSGSKVLLDV